MVTHSRCVLSPEGWGAQDLAILLPAFSVNVMLMALRVHAPRTNHPCCSTHYQHSRCGASQWLAGTAETSPVGIRHFQRSCSLFWCSGHEHSTLPPYHSRSCGFCCHFLWGCTKKALLRSSLPVQVRDRANLSIKLSAMVLNHQVAKIVLLEQIYRAWTILNGEPYHH